MFEKQMKDYQREQLILITVPMLIVRITTNYPTELLFFAEGVSSGTPKLYIPIEEGEEVYRHEIIAKAHEGRTKCHWYY